MRYAGLSSCESISLTGKLWLGKLRACRGRGLEDDDCGKRRGVNLDHRAPARARRVGLESLSRPREVVGEHSYAQPSLARVGERGRCRFARSSLSLAKKD